MASTSSFASKDQALAFIVELLCADTKNLISKLCTVSDLQKHDKVGLREEELQVQRGGYISYVSTAVSRMISAQDRDKSMTALELLYTRCFGAIAALEFAHSQTKDTSLSKDVRHALVALRVSIQRSLQGLEELKETYTSDPGTAYRIEHRIQWIRNRLGTSEQASTPASGLEDV